MDICSVFLCLLFLTACGVFSVDADEVKSVSVMEGQNVTLYTDDELQTDDRIVWYYGPNNTLLAIMNGKNLTTIHNETEIFKDRLKLNYQTGDLTITHITSQHSGLYTLKISSNMKVSYKTFNLTVNRSDIINLNNKQDQDLITDASSKSSDSHRMRVIIISVVVPLVICMIFIFIFVFKGRRMCHKESVSETIYDPVSDKGSSRPPEESNSSTSPDELE